MIYIYIYIYSCEYFENMDVVIFHLMSLTASFRITH